MSHRIHPLDWLRGLMASSILIYHSASFTSLGWQTDSSSVLGKLGIYGVSIFFILSGLSMAVVYHAALGSVVRTAVFFAKRAFRIWPLLTLAVAMKAIPAWISGHPYSIKMLAANVTGLFGFIAPTTYVNTGAWSIGNEMVFYALTPILILVYSRSSILGNLIVGLTAAIGAVFAFAILSPTRTLPEQWAWYVNPLNNLYLYTCGVAIFYNLRNVRIPNRWRWLVLAIPVTLFVALPADGDQIQIVTGFNRLALSLISLLIVIAFYKASPSLPASVEKGLEMLGMASYGIYLLHPFLIDVATAAFSATPKSPIAFVASVLIGSIILALIIYALLERPFMRFGKKVTKRWVDDRREPSGGDMTIAADPSGMAGTTAPRAAA